MSTKPAPQSTLMKVLSTLGRTIIARVGWLFGSVLLVFSAGFLLLWWNLLEQRNAIAGIQARATASTQAQLVQRFYRLTPTDLDSLPSHLTCEEACLISVESVAIFAFTRADGSTQTVEFSEPAHDWQHNTPFELGIPLLKAEFRIDPAFHAKLLSMESKYSQGQTVWSLFWEPVEDAGHWLLRLRDPPASFSAPLRYDPEDPTVAVLDAPAFREAQAKVADNLDWTVFGMLFFVGVICLTVLYPAVNLMLVGYSPRITIAVTVAICLSVPLWAPHAGSIAPRLSGLAGSLADELRREFSSGSLPSYLARPAADDSSLRSLTWQLAASPQAEFLRGLDTRVPPDVQALDHAGAFDALQASFDRQLQGLDHAEAEQVLQQLRHHEADTVWELFVPALQRITGDATASEAMRADAADLLLFFARDWRLPDVDVFLYRHRLNNYARLLQSSDSGIRELARSRLDEAEEILKRQLATY